MIRTIPSNNIILFPIIYLSIIIWGFNVSENLTGLIFYAAVLFLFLSLFAYFREKKIALLRVEEGVLKVRYLFNKGENKDFYLYKIEGHIELERYLGGELVSTFPSVSDYLNYRSYFTPEKFLLRLQHAGKIETIEFNVNVIGFNYFMIELVKRLRSINSEKLKTITTNFDTFNVTFNWLTLITKYFIDFD